jgi:hypothetical protein
MCGVIGVCLYAFAAFILWALASQRFRLVSGRIDRLPPGPPPAAKPRANDSGNRT